MPTGYTADVGDGKVTDFRTFALRCGRAFGATVMQRDNAMDEPPKHREESAFYTEHVAAGEAEVARLATLSEAEAQREMEAEAVTAKATNERWRLERGERRARYEAMLAKVRDWHPPTEEHQGVQEFMEGQLTESIKSDCHELSVDEPEPVTAAEWLMAKRVTAAETLTRDLGSLKEEQERVATANAWIDALYESLAKERITTWPYQPSA